MLTRANVDDARRTTNGRRTQICYNILNWYVRLNQSGKFHLTLSNIKTLSDTSLADDLKTLWKKIVTKEEIAHHEQIFLFVTNFSTLFI